MLKNFIRTKIEPKLESLADKVVQKLFTKSSVLEEEINYDMIEKLVFVSGHTCVMGRNGGLYTWNRRGRASYMNSKTGRLYSFESNPDGQMRQARAEQMLIEAGVERPGA